MKEYPHLTPYQFASNTPIMAIDQDGLEAIIAVFFDDGSSKPTVYQQKREGLDWYKKRENAYDAYGSSESTDQYQWASGYEAYQREAGHRNPDGSYQGGGAGLLVVNKIGNKTILAYQSAYDVEGGTKALLKQVITPEVTLKEALALNWKAAKLFNPISPSSNPLVEGSEDYKNAVNNYKTMVSMAITLGGSFKASLLGKTKLTEQILNTLSVINSLDDAASTQGTPVMETLLTEGFGLEKETAQYAKAAISFTSAFSNGAGFVKALKKDKQLAIGKIVGMMLDASSGASSLPDSDNQSKK